MLAFLEAVAFARIDDELRLHTALMKRGIEFLRLAERRAAVFRAVKNERRRRRLVEPHQRRSVERDVAVALLGERPAVDEAVKIVIARIVTA